MRHLTPRRVYRAYMTILGVAGVVAALGGLFVAALAGSSAAAPTVAPSNTGEPGITGTASVGQTMSASTGSWSGSDPKTFSFRWLRCDAERSQPDGSDCVQISGANLRTYEVRKADVGFRLRVRVTATNAYGSAPAASNPTAVVAAAKPVNTDRPSISGTPVVGNRLRANRGSWNADEPITYAFRWLRCTAEGENCSEISNATDNEYVVVEGDVGRTVRVRVTARSDDGSTSAVSPQTGVVQRAGSSGSSISVTEVPRTERLVVSEVRFSPNPATSQTNPINVRIRVTDTRGNVIREALVFIRSTPRVTSGGNRQATNKDGWVEYRLVPNANFRVRTGYSVQFFVKAYRAGDPPLAGIAAYRLVQVRTANI